jgi:hypothetical protein
MPAPDGPIESFKVKRGARVTKDTVPTASRPAGPGVSAAQQRICTECGDPFVSSTSTAKTCCPTHRKRRARRIEKEMAATGTFSEYAVDVSEVTAAMEKASAGAFEDLPAIARQVAAEELRPYVREALSGAVLDSIGDMLGLMPLVQDALRDDLTALAPVFDKETGVQLLDTDNEPVLLPDYDRRARAVSVVLKYTVAQPGLAPQPDTPESGGVTVVFGGMPEPVVNATVVEEAKLAEIESGASRQCDICAEVKPSDEFVAGSSRCAECQAALRARIDAQVAEMEGRAGG